MDETARTSAAEIPGTDGETLTRRLARGPLPTEEALEWALGIGAALARLHARNAVHGALAPDLARRTAAGVTLLDPNPALTGPSPYHAPEQLAGAAPDQRSDVFAFGAIVYELATGRPAPRDEAVRTAVQPTLDPVRSAMERVARSCLARDPAGRRQRVQNAVSDLRLAAGALPKAVRLRTRVLASSLPAGAGKAASKDTGNLPPLPLIGVVPPGNTRLRFWGQALCLVALLAAAILLGVWLGQPTPVPALDLAIAPPVSVGYAGPPAISPDGANLAFAGDSEDGGRALWLRPFSSGVPSRLAGTEHAEFPFWSPNGEEIGFFASRQLKAVRISSGAVRNICAVEAIAGGGSWSRSGLILFAAGITGGLSSVPETGGLPTPVTALSGSNQESAHLWPQFVSAKDFVVFVRSGQPGSTGIYFGRLGNAALRRLASSEASAVYAPGGGPLSSKGSLIYLKDGALSAQPYAAGDDSLQGTAAPLVYGLQGASSLSLLPATVSSVGVLAYVRLQTASRELVWTGRNGEPLTGAGMPGNWGQVRLAPDGSHGLVAKVTNDYKASNVFRVSMDGHSEPLTTGPGRSESAVVSADGQRFIYLHGAASDLSGETQLLVQTAGSEKGEALISSGDSKMPSDWTRDGRYLIYTSWGADTRYDLMAYTFATRRAAPLLQTIHEEAYAAVSPDGRWLAYQSDESGAVEVYVQQFNPTGDAMPQPHWQVSRHGGSLPRWRGDGGELFFLTPAGAMMAATVRTTSGAIAFDEPQRLFQTRPLAGIPCWFDVAAGGQRFLINLPMEWSAGAEIQVISDWRKRGKR